MKYILKIIFVLLLAIAIVFGVYCITDIRNTDIKKNDSNLTTVTKAPVTEKGSDRELLTKYSEGDDNFELYQRGTDTILVHNSREFEFNDWSRYILLEEPEMHFRDYDRNPDDKELAIKVVSSVNSDTGEYFYDIYLVRFKTDKDNKEHATMFVASNNTWHSILENGVKLELSQPSFCDKFVQVAMTYIWDKNITYNDEGIAQSLYHAFSHAMKNPEGGYYKTERWSFGKAIYGFNEDGEIQIYVDVKINYEDTDVVQDLGIIKFRLVLNKDNDFVCQEKSMSFVPNKEYRSLNPRSKAEADWKYVENNIDKYVPEDGDKNIDWIKYKFDYDPTINEKSVSYAREDTEIRNVSKLEFTSKYIKLYAKKGCIFSKNPAKTGAFKVVVDLGRGDDDEYEIAYKANVEEKNGIQVLTIEFENDYPQEYFKSLTVYYNTES